MQELITPAQSKKLHTLLGNLGLMDEKRQIIADFTNDRTSSSRQLTLKEAAVLIDGLDKQDPATREKREANGGKIKRIYAIWYELEWIAPTDNEIEKRINRAAIDVFLKKRGVYKKQLQAYTTNELQELVSQFESIRKHCMEQNNRNAFKAEMDSILAEVRVSWNDKPEKVFFKHMKK